MKEGLSRRNFLKIVPPLVLGGGVVAASVALYDRREAASNVVPARHPLFEKKQQPQWEIDAIMAAGMVRLSWGDGSGLSFLNGHGGIFYDRDGNVAVKSIGHVVNPQEFNQSGRVLTVQVPGVLETYTIPSGGMFSWQTEGEQNKDSVYSFTIPEGSFLDSIMEQMMQGKITPLVEAPYETLLAGDVLYTPNGNSITSMKYSRYDSADGLLICDPGEGELCQGVSGQPAVKVGKRVTNEAVGLVADGYFPDKAKRCTNTQYFIRPFD